MNRLSTRMESFCKNELEKTVKNCETQKMQWNRIAYGICTLWFMKWINSICSWIFLLFRWLHVSTSSYGDVWLKIVSPELNGFMFIFICRCRIVVESNFFHLCTPFYCWNRGQRQKQLEWRALKWEKSLIYRHRRPLFVHTT